MALLIGMIGIGNPSYWSYEARSLSVATRPLPDQLRVAGNTDIVHALHNSILGAWISAFGMGETATRSLSLIAFAFAAVGFTLFLARLRGTTTALIGGALFILLPGIAWAGGEARGYAFALACSMWSLVVLEALLHERITGRTQRGIAWVCYALLILLTMGFFLLAALMVFAHLHLVRHINRDFGRTWLAAWVVPVAALLPFIVTAVGQTASLSGGGRGLRSLGSSLLVGQLFWGPRYNTGISAAMISAVLLTCVCAVLVIHALLMLRSSARDYSPEGYSDNSAIWFGITLFALPTVVLAVAAMLGTPLYHERYLLFAAPGFCIVVAEVIRGLRLSKARRFAVAGVVVALCVPQLVTARGEAAKAGDDFRSLAAAAAGADVVVYDRPSARGVSIAYPGVVTGRDVMLLMTPSKSATIWGLSRDIDRVAPEKLVSDNVALVYYPASIRDSVLDALLEMDCVQMPGGHESGRFAVVYLDCSAVDSSDS